MDNNNTHLAPVIHIAESPEQAINYKWHSSFSRLNSNVVVLDSCDIQRLGNERNNFCLPYDLTPGEVLIRHPYNQGYIQATDAENEYVNDAAEGVLLIARCLGASEISFITFISFSQSLLCIFPLLKR